MVHDKSLRGRQHHGLPHQQKRHSKGHPQKARHLIGNNTQHPKGREGITAFAPLLFAISVGVLLT